MEKRKSAISLNSRFRESPRDSRRPQFHPRQDELGAAFFLSGGREAYFETALRN